MPSFVLIKPHVCAVLYMPCCSVQCEQSFATATQVALNRGCHRMLLSLPAACCMPSFVLIEPHVCAVLRHMMEDPATLEAWMESEIRNFFANKARFVCVRVCTCVRLFVC